MDLLPPELPWLSNCLNSMNNSSKTTTQMADLENMLFTKTPWMQCASFTYSRNTILLAISGQCQSPPIRARATKSNEMRSRQQMQYKQFRCLHHHSLRHFSFPCADSALNIKSGIIFFNGIFYRILDPAPHQEDFRRLVAAGLGLFLHHDLEFCPELFHDLAETHIFKTFHQQYARWFQMQLRKFDGQIDQMYQVRGVRRGNARQIGRHIRQHQVHFASL